MDEVVVRRVVGVVTLAIAAFLLSWLLPRPGLDRLRGADERVVTMDLTRADSRPEEASTPATGDPDVRVAGGSMPPADPGSGASMSEAQGDRPGAYPPVAPAPVPPVVAADPAPPESAPEPVDVIAMPKLDPKPAVKPDAKLAPRPVAKPAAKPDVVPQVKPEPKPEPKPAPKPETKPAPTTAPVAKPAESTPSGKVMVQAGAYSILDKAEGVRKRASARGVSCFIAPAETPKGTLYRLRCGPFADRAKAGSAVQALTADGIAAQVVGAER